MEEIWSIQEVVKAAEVTSRTLRYYDEIGLLTPDALTGGGQRNYSKSNLIRLQRMLTKRFTRLTGTQ